MKVVQRLIPLTSGYKWSTVVKWLKTTGIQKRRVITTFVSAEA